MVWQRVNEVKVEVAQELGIVLEDDEQDAHYCRVEALQRRCNYLSRQHVVLKESKALNNQVLDLDLALEGSISLCISPIIFGHFHLVIGTIARLSLDEMRHELLVRDQFKPSKCKRRVVVRV